MRSFLICCDNSTLDRLKATLRDENVSVCRTRSDHGLLMVRCLPDDADRISRLDGVHYVSQAPIDFRCDDFGN